MVWKGEKTTAPTELLFADQWERERLHNPYGELGLAAELQRAVAIFPGGIATPRRNTQLRISAGTF